MSGWCSCCSSESADGIYICLECEEVENAEIEEIENELAEVKAQLEKAEKEIEILTIEKDELKKYSTMWFDKNNELEQELQKTREQLEKAEDILKMYASRNNWNSRKEAIMLCEYVGGETARQYFKDKQGE